MLIEPQLAVEHDFLFQIDDLADKATLSRVVGTD
jgi:hypothetical protein